MKRTTYIIFGVMLAGLLAMSGIIFYMSLYTIEWEETFMEIKGDRQTVALPPCRVVKLTQPQTVWKQKSKGIVEAERVVSFIKAPLAVVPVDSLQGSLSLAGDMVPFVSVTAAGDTVCIEFDISDGKIEKRFRDVHWLKVTYSNLFFWASRWVSPGYCVIFKTVLSFLGFRFSGR